MINVGQARDLVEIYTKQENIDPTLFRTLLNAKLREFAGKTGVLESSATLSSVADTSEYELPLDCSHVKDVIFDSYRAKKMTHWQVQELTGQV